MIVRVELFGILGVDRLQTCKQRFNSPLPEFTFRRSRRWGHTVPVQTGSFHEAVNIQTCSADKMGTRPRAEMSRMHSFAAST